MGQGNLFEKGPLHSVGILVVPALKDEGGGGGWWGSVIVGNILNKTFCTCNAIFLKKIDLQKKWFTPNYIVVRLL